MKAALNWIAVQLRQIQANRLCSEHSGSQHYWRGYRDALRNVREVLKEVASDNA